MRISCVFILYRRKACVYSLDILYRRKAYAGNGMHPVPSHTPADAVGRGLANSAKPFCPQTTTPASTSFILCFE